MSLWTWEQRDVSGERSKGDDTDNDSQSEMLWRRLFVFKIESFWTPWMWYRDGENIVMISGLYTGVFHFVLMMYFVDLLTDTDRGITIGPFFDSDSTDDVVSIVLYIVYSLLYLSFTTLMVFYGFQTNRLYFVLIWLLMTTFDSGIMFYYIFDTCISSLSDYPIAILIIMSLTAYEVYCLCAVMSHFQKKKFNIDVIVLDRQWYGDTENIGIPLASMKSKISADNLYYTSYSQPTL
ncbi:Uncharacterised protein g401 [Pycnogonum litorale]